MVRSTDRGIHTACPRQPKKRFNLYLKRSFGFLGVFLLALGGGWSCGAQVRGHGQGVAKLIKRAWANGAYKCAPKDLTLAESHLRFARDRLNQGQYFNAKEHMGLADKHARAALRKSPKERCAPRKVVEVPPRPRPRPVKVVVKIKDTDKD